VGFIQEHFARWWQNHQPGGISGMVVAREIGEEKIVYRPGDLYRNLLNVYLFEIAVVSFTKSQGFELSHATDAACKDG
jgi:hypothetical protein